MAIHYLTVGTGWPHGIGRKIAAIRVGANRVRRGAMPEAVCDALWDTLHAAVRVGIGVRPLAANERVDPRYVRRSMALELR